MINLNNKLMGYVFIIIGVLGWIGLIAIDKQSYTGPVLFLIGLGAGTLIKSD